MKRGSSSSNNNNNSSSFSSSDDDDDSLSFSEEAAAAIITKTTATIPRGEAAAAAAARQGDINSSRINATTTATLLGRGSGVTRVTFMEIVAGVIAVLSIVTSATAMIMVPPLSSNMVYAAGGLSW